MHTCMEGKALRALQSILTTQLGRCGTCMRLAFLFASGASAAALFLALWSPIAGAAVGFVFALPLTALWIAHVAMFVRRSVRATALRAAGGDPARQRAELWPRRKVLAAFVRTLAFSAATSLVVQRAAAQGCNCYTENDCYCPPDFPQCVFNPSTGEAICCGADAVGCAGPYQTWCCPGNTQCYGTEGQCWG